MGMSDIKLVYWLDEIGKEYSEIVGKKCANLGELRKAKVRTPTGFVLSLKAYDEFMKKTGSYDEICRWLSTFNADCNDHKDLPKFNEASNVLRNVLESKMMPSHIKDIVGQYYNQLCKTTGIANVPVAVRSAGPASHPGQYETYLYVKGESQVISHIIKVWLSTFNMRSLIARARHGVSLEYDPIGVAVIQMINARAAGVLFSIEPTKPDFTKMAIEGNWGLGESVVSGEVTPDGWIVDRSSLRVFSYEIAQKKHEYIFDPKTDRACYVEIPPERQEVPCLSEDEVHELAKLGKHIERHFGSPQDIEWAIENGSPLPEENIVILQTRPQKIKSSIINL
jgi:pyruvate,water dikinase